MKIITIIVLIFLGYTSARADILIAGKQEMIDQSEIIALVDIQELTSTDKTQVYLDLIATAQVSKVLKGDISGRVKFRIPRFFPCAAFDVSTGRHLVFLKKNENDEYVGMNWHMSYLYLGGNTTQWFDERGAITDTYKPEQVVCDVEEGLQKSSNQSLELTRDNARF